MIQANELRLGNNIYYFGKFVTVLKIERCGAVNYISTSINNRSLQNSYNEQSAYDPIPLSEQILLKCGFKHHKEFLQGVFLRIQLGQDFYISWKNGFSYIDREGYECKYLHEIQNLFFILSKKELEINL